MPKQQYIYKLANAIKDILDSVVLFFLISLINLIILSIYVKLIIWSVSLTLDKAQVLP